MSRSFALITRTLRGPMRSSCFCAGGQRLEALVGVAIADPLRLERSRSVDHRRGKQRDDRALERVVERIGRMPRSRCASSMRGFSVAYSLARAAGGSTDATASAMVV